MLVQKEPAFLYYFDKLETFRIPVACQGYLTRGSGRRNITSSLARMKVTEAEWTIFVINSCKE